MIKYVRGDVTEPDFDTDVCVIVNGVNNRRMYGLGLAKTIAKKWPKARQDYIEWEQYNLGSVLYSIQDHNICIAHLVSQDGIISKKNPKPAKPLAIRQGLSFILNDLEKSEMSYTIATVKIGCGLGGLDWSKEIQPIVSDVFDRHEVHVYEL